MDILFKTAWFRLVKKQKPSKNCWMTWNKLLIKMISYFFKQVRYNETITFLGIVPESFFANKSSVHTKDIATCTRDWVASISEKLHQECLSSIALRKVIVDQWMCHYAEKKAIFTSQQEQSGAGNGAMYALTQRMVELHNRSQPTEMIQGVLPNTHFQRLMSDDFVLRSKETLLEAQRQRSQIQSEFLPGRNTTKLFKSIWPCSQKQAPVDQAIAHFTSPQNPTIKFPRFLSLPLEPRRMVWKAALLDGRIVSKRKWVPEQLSSEEPCYRLALQLACKESYKVMHESYTLVLELKTDTMASTIWRIYAAFLYWDRKFFGLTGVKHLALKVFHFDDILGQKHCVDKTRKEALDRIEASCPNLKSLTITWTSERCVRKYFGDDSIQGSDYKLIDIDSNFVDHMAEIPVKDQATREAMRID
ncbi:1d543b52-3f56-4f0f-b9bd-7edc6883aacb-CDS [Sclerotinia trifoliorum]|uniref:1d543b52-3f56-4f0f-b9bd-7edc6883aacb-CDS n=1 Tax=Sclerotinia trifoliorum TaxID=28548 RepID=A0A8H2VKD4_9HELO|nr:1d543b52-3f56-4f0f-b9bd-7edc6883aacb-CDS [Sclerotinia trifoliorum]